PSCGRREPGRPRTKVGVEWSKGSRPIRRVLVIVLDSCGVGALPDAAEFGDAGASTLPHTAAACGGLRLPGMGRLGLGRIVPLEGVPPDPAPAGAFGKMAETSRGKDSTTGHWELMGLVLDRPFPTYPRGFPPEVIQPFEARIGRPFLGPPGRFVRTDRRRDFSLPPPRPTVLDRLHAAGVPVLAVGKIGDLFAGRGITEAIHTHNDMDGMAQTLRAMGRLPAGLIFTNLVDLDTLFGHRNNPRGYGDDLEQIDREMAKVVAGLGPE